jgi:acyl-CoA synthetase (AMP-forming)/AMP-acid ligase II
MEVHDFHQGRSQSLRHLIEGAASRDPSVTAIAAPGRAALTCGRLVLHIDEVHHVLRRSGVGLRDRVALVVPNGSDLAVAFLGVAASAACAPPIRNIKRMCSRPPSRT